MDGIDVSFSAILSRGWKLLLFRGLAAIAFGVFTWARPAISLAALVILFGIYALADGILACWAAITGREDREYWWVLLLVGLLGSVIGVLTLSRPQITAVALLFYVAAWAIGKGVLEIVTGIRLHKAIDGEWRLIVAGLASVLFGVFLMSRPATGALVLASLIAAYAIGFGVLLVLVAFRTREIAERAAREARLARG